MQKELGWKRSINDTMMIICFILLVIISLGFYAYDIDNINDKAANWIRYNIFRDKD